MNSSSKDMGAENIDNTKLPERTETLKDVAPAEKNGARRTATVDVDSFERQLQWPGGTRREAWRTPQWPVAT